MVDIKINGNTYVGVNSIKIPLADDSNYAQFSYDGMLNSLLAGGLADLTSDAGSIREYACYGARVTSATFPEAITIGQSAFYKCTSLTNASFPKATVCNSYAFQQCSALTTIELSKVQFVCSYAFNKCSALLAADFPKVTELATYAFSSCTNLAEVNFPELLSVASYAFETCTSLTEVNFPKVTSLGEYTFKGCTKLTEANLPNLTSDLSTQVFYNCRALTTVYAPNASWVDDSAFYNCNVLSSLDFNTLNGISDKAFYNCSALVTLILRNTEAVCTLNNANAFSNTPIASGTGYIYVPLALIDSYKAASNWSTYADRFRALEDYIKEA